MISKKGSLIVVLIIWGFGISMAQEKLYETNLAGVFQGKILFIQNPYDKNDNQFCIEEIRVNDSRMNINYKLSAIKLDFEGFEMYSPIRIKVLHKDSLCNSVVINPEAILFHTIFRFVTTSLSDTALVWTTKGERGIGSFEVEKLQDGFWVSEEIIEAKGVYEGCEYIHYPNMEEGANKYRVKYKFPPNNRLQFLYSQEVEYDFYPDPVVFSPKTVKTKLYLSRATHFEIYDAGDNLVLEGRGTEIDVRVLRRGRYVIYFNRKDPGIFVKE